VVDWFVFWRGVLFVYIILLVGVCWEIWFWGCGFFLRVCGGCCVFVCVGVGVCGSGGLCLVSSVCGGGSGWFVIVYVLFCVCRWLGLGVVGCVIWFGLWCCCVGLVWEGVWV
jgi:hypothetical protein